MASIAVEGKKEESFGPILDEWVINASNGKSARLAFLTQLLNLPSSLPGSLRYQFLHRSACAIVEAQRFHANIAILLLQSFSNKDTGFSDYSDFIGLFGHTGKQGDVVLLNQSNGISFYSAWVQH